MKTRCEIYLAINEDGDWVVSGDGNTEATDGLVDNFGGNQIRVVKITAHITRPILTEATVDVPDDAGTTRAVETEVA